MKFLSTSEEIFILGCTPIILRDGERRILVGLARRSQHPIIPNVGAIALRRSLHFYCQPQRETLT
jgi:hypothetical protein